MAEAFRQYLQGCENVERVQTREELSTQEKSLGAIASRAGVLDFPLFQNAGYRGMYCMNLSQLRQLKGVSVDRSVLDFMGSEGAGLGDRLKRLLGHREYNRKGWMKWV